MKDHFICGIVVTHNRDIGLLSDGLRAVVPQIDALVVIDNSTNEALVDRLKNSLDVMSVDAIFR